MPNTPQKITFGLVGCGRVAAQHLRALAHHQERAELVGVCDPDAERARGVCEKFQSARPPRAFPTLDAMLDERAPDVVVIASPTGLHPAQATRAAERGAHVMCEKPIATSFQKGIEVVRACQRAQKHLFVVKQLRYNPTLQWLKKAVSSGRFGNIYMVETSVFWTRPQSYYDEATWRGTRQMDGGALLNQTSHYIDLLSWIFGPVARVQAMAHTLGRQIEVEDSGVINLKWRSGALGSMAVTLLTYPKNLRAQLTVTGSLGTAVLGGTACDRIDLAAFEESDARRAQTAREVAQINQQTRAVYGHGHRLYYANVLDVLQHGAAVDVNGEQGLKSLEIIEAAYRSNRSGQAVELPLSPAASSLT